LLSRRDRDIVPSPEAVPKLIQKQTVTRVMTGLNVVEARALWFNK